MEKCIVASTSCVFFWKLLTQRLRKMIKQPLKHSDIHLCSQARTINHWSLLFKEQSAQSRAVVKLQTLTVSSSFVDDARHFQSGQVSARWILGLQGRLLTLKKIPDLKTTAKEKKTTLNLMLSYRNKRLNSSKWDTNKATRHWGAAWVLPAGLRSWQDYTCAERHGRNGFLSRNRPDWTRLDCLLNRFRPIPLSLPNASLWEIQKKKNQYIDIKAQVRLQGRGNPKKPKPQSCLCLNNAWNHTLVQTDIYWRVTTSPSSLTEPQPRCYRLSVPESHKTLL